MTEQRKIPSGLCATLLGAAVLAVLWHRNYNLIGDTYDYSIVTSVSGYLHAGMKPYRDFTTPLQSLTIYLCYFAELIFGRRYLALSYMNLIIGMSFYAVLARMLRNYLPPLLDILAATAICAATYFQHGLLWYNSLAISLLMLASFCAAIMYRRQSLDRNLFIALCAVLYLSSMCKVNYHTLAFAIVGGILALLFLIAPDQRRKIFWALPCLFLFGVALGPVTEVLINGTSFHTYWYCVFETPKHRLKRFLELVDPTIILGKTSDFLPDNWCSGVYLFSLLIFCSCLYFVVRSAAKSAGQIPAGGRSWPLRYFGAVMLAGFYVSSLFVTITNSEIEWLTSAFLMAGLAATFIMFAPVMSLEQNLCFKIGLFLLTGFFLIGGGSSAFMHSRVRPGEPGLIKTIFEAIYKTRKISAWKTAVPFYSAESISPELSPYFGGMRFTEMTHSRLVKIVAFADKYDFMHQPNKVYWGSGLQVMNRVYGEVPVGRFPLWYHFGVTVRNEDAPAIVDAFKKNDYEWVFCTHWIVEMPNGVRDYLTNNYDEVGDEDLIVFHQKHVALAPKAEAVK